MGSSLSYLKDHFIYCLLIVILCHCKQSSKTDINNISELQKNVVDLDYPDIVERGYINAILDNSSTGLFIYKGKTMGYEFELLEMFAQQHGLELRINTINSLEQCFTSLNSGEGDIIAYNLTVTKERKKRIDFTHYHNLEEQVLIQRKPDNWRDMKIHEIEEQLIRNPIDLIGKEVYVRNHSAFFDRLRNLSDEIGGDIIIIEDDPEIETEAIIKKVAEGEINYTVADEGIALVNASYYPNLDVKTAVSFPTQIAWGVRKNSDSLLNVLNTWILEMRKTVDYYVIYDKYFKSRKASLRRSKSEYFSVGGGKLSPYDVQIKKVADVLEWDWRLLAAQIFQESRFDPAVVSWAGARGLMQVLPSTGLEHGVTDLLDPYENIKAGGKQLEYLDTYFEEYVEDPEERKKFVLGAYNVGHGHVRDAMRLTTKYGGDPTIWKDNVENYLLKKSLPKFYNDSVVQFGYCRGSEPVGYVSTIYNNYENYLMLFPKEEPINENS